MRIVELQGIDNVRDLGEIPVCGGRKVVPGLLFRGSALVGITDFDSNRLFNELSIRCVIDLRCGWERTVNPDAKVSGVENLHIPFYDLEKVGLEYTEPAAGTKRVGQDVACEPRQFYHSLANRLTVRQICMGVNEVLSRAMRGTPVYFHCSGGKDRAGILALLILSVLGASREAILDDYLLTNVARDKNYDKMFKRFLCLADGDSSRAHELVIAHRALPQNLDAFYAAICDTYGGIGAFIRNQLHIDEAQRAVICEKLTKNQGMR